MAPVRTAVCIATTGRADILLETLSHVARQTLKPDDIFICQLKSDDVDKDVLSQLQIEISYLDFASGLTAQRNALLNAANGADLIVFIDDDFLMHRNYIANAVANFEHLADVAMLTGKVLADGATGPGLETITGRNMLEKIAECEITAKVRQVFNAYGCNMVINWSLIRDKGCRFDENLPLYGWQEDVDFSRQAAIFGNIYKCDNMIGVHLGSKSGRVSGFRFGYSQVANQFYLIKKGTIPPRIALRKLFENLIANFIGLFRNEEYVDRRGRVKGNLTALSDALMGRLSPLRILDAS